MIELLVFLILGLVGLWIGADIFVQGTKNIAKHFGISHFFIGLAFVSIGTSIPEIAVSVVGGLDRLAGLEASGIVVGNIIGSALIQISLLFGILSFIIPLKLEHDVTIKQGAALLGSVVLVFLLASDGFLSRLDGVIVIAAYIVYYVFSWISHSEHRPGPKPSMNLIQDIVYILAGLALVWFCSDVVVGNGVELASALDIHQSLIGILLVGLGTGLPELSVALTSLRREAVGISLGNLIGSNICDLLFSLGSGTVISGFLVEPVNLWFDFPVLFGFSLFVLFFFYTGRRISKREGLLLIALFLLYAGMKIFVTG